MSSPEDLSTFLNEDLSAFINEDLFDFILKDGVPGPELPDLGNDLMQDWGMLEDKVLDKELDDFLNSLMNFADEPGTLPDCLPADSDSSISEGQLPSCSTDSNLASGFCSSGVVHADHNYSLYVHGPVLESTMSDMAQEGAFIDLGTGIDLEALTKALEEEQSFSLPVAAESIFPQLVLTEEEKELLEKDGISLPTHKPLNKTQERLLKKVRQRIRNKHSASDSRRRRKMYVDDLERRLAACIAQNQKLQKKVELLQKQNLSLLKQLQKLWASFKQAKNKTTITTCGMVVLLSLSLKVPASFCLPGKRERKLEITVHTQRIRKVPNQAAPDGQDGAVAEELSSQPEEPSTSGSFNPSGEEGQSAPDMDATSSVDNNSSSDPPMAEGSEPGHPQPQEQHVKSSPVQTVVSMVWENGSQEQRQHAATVVIEHHRANGK